MPKTKPVPRHPDLLFSAKLDGHVGLNDVLLLHEDGRREKITRQEHEKRIKKELEFEKTAAIKGRHHGKSGIDGASLQRSGVDESSGHRLGHIKQSKKRKGLSVRPADIKKAGLPGGVSAGLVNQKSGHRKLLKDTPANQSKF
jgi:hypothetical protein